MREKEEKEKKITFIWEIRKHFLEQAALTVIKQLL